MKMKKLILSAALCVACAPLFAANTNTFVLRPGRPATDAETTLGTNKTAWVTPYGTSLLKTTFTPTAALIGYSKTGSSTNWEWIEVWGYTPVTTTNAVFTVTFAAAMTNGVGSVSVSPSIVAGYTAGFYANASVVSYTTNSITIQVVPLNYNNSCFGYFRVGGK